MRDAVQEVGGAVERIDDPAMMAVAARLDSAFLHQEAVAGPRLASSARSGLLGLEIGGGDEIAGALDRDLELLDFAEVARTDRAPPCGRRRP